jgi:hypothetical protein
MVRSVQMRALVTDMRAAVSYAVTRPITGSASIVCITGMQRALHVDLFDSRSEILGMTCLAAAWGEESVLTLRWVSKSVVSNASIKHGRGWNECTCQRFCKRCKHNREDLMGVEEGVDK